MTHTYYCTQNINNNNNKYGEKRQQNKLEKKGNKKRFDIKRYHQYATKSTGELYDRHRQWCRSCIPSPSSSPGTEYATRAGGAQANTPVQPSKKTCPRTPSRGGDDDDVTRLPVHSRRTPPGHPVSTVSTSLYSQPQHVQRGVTINLLPTSTSWQHTKKKMGVSWTRRPIQSHNGVTSTAHRRKICGPRGQSKHVLYTRPLETRASLWRNFWKYGGKGLSPYYNV